MAVVRVAVSLALILQVLGVGPSKAALECAGSNVAQTDAAGDSIDPFLSGRGVPAPDLLGFRVDWGYEALTVSWRIEGGYPALKQHPAARLLLVGWGEYWTFGSTPYVFLEFSESSGPRYGLGVHFDATHPLQTNPSGTGTLWEDTVVIPGEPFVAGDWMTVRIPAKSLVESTHWIGYTQGTEMESSSIHGRPTSPIATVLINASGGSLNESSESWGIADAAPEGRFEGNPVQGYKFRFVAGGGGVPPLLCRPGVPGAGGGTPGSCSGSYSDLKGPLWVGIPFDVSGGAASDRVRASLGVGGGPTHTAALGLVSESGDMYALVGDPFGSEQRVDVQTNGLRLKEWSNDSRGGKGFSFGYGGSLPRPGRWMLIAILSPEVSLGDLSWELSGAGYSCGSPRVGTEVGFTAFEDFEGSTSVAVAPHVEASPVLYGGAEGSPPVHVGGSTTVTADEGLLSFFSAASDHVGITHIEQTDPSGVTTIGQVAQLDVVNFRQPVRLVEFGGPGTYRFKLNRHVSTNTVYGRGSLLWLDADLFPSS